MSFDTPWSFHEKLVHQHWTIEYQSMTEACQGGPLIGSLLINGIQFQAGTLFGGPLLVNGKDLFIPVFERKLFSTGFRLLRLDLATNSFEIFPQKYPLIWLESLEGETLIFAIDSEKNAKRMEHIRK